ncbi:caltractin-like [Teleopsis dalmanni]|uniref:caltractin-like n=1 Tax=Teleopsis dalmanni TaxID=139649 RepID=UPI0018CC7E9B|nr:caltractin-like [Teleopsis dalmanni]
MSTASNTRKRQKAPPIKSITPEKILQRYLEERSNYEDDESGTSMDSDFETCKAKKIGHKLRFDDRQLLDMKETFDLLDSNCTGILRDNHLRVAVRALGFEPRKDDIKAMIAKINEDNTERISFNDFVKLMELKIGEKDTEMDLRKSFRLFCGVGKNSLTLDDLKLVSRQLGENLNDEELAEMFEYADLNKDGKVNEDDYIRLVLNTVLYDQ